MLTGNLELGLKLMTKLAAAVLRTSAFTLAVLSSLARAAGCDAPRAGCTPEDVALFSEDELREFGSKLRVFCQTVATRERVVASNSCLERTQSLLTKLAETTPNLVANTTHVEVAANATCLEIFGANEPTQACAFFNLVGEVPIRWR